MKVGKGRIIVIFIIMLNLCSFLASPVFSIEPKREDGLSAHWVPERVASLGKDEKVQSGFLASYRSKDRIIRKYCATPADLLLYFKSFPPSFQNNGIWVIMTHPDAYSPEELRMKEELVKLCQKDKILLFICRGSELPDGWQKYSPTPK